MLAAAIETLLRRDDLAVLVALATLTLLAWVALLLGAGTGMDPVAMSGWSMPLALPPALSADWSAAYWLIAFLMWACMMVAMMLPSASPMVLLYARVARQAERQGHTANAPRRSPPSRRLISRCGFFSACWPPPFSGDLSISAPCRR